MHAPKDRYVICKSGNLQAAVNLLAQGAAHASDGLNDTLAGFTIPPGVRIVVA